ncbi:hypothetical protein V7S43_007033 [Phytophthora oleae]|uniref:Uncharacterized protein n=1 Tax=Phytophthora oleae TaxID=2107226 RepID=A0ABD3FR46_9STRA
MVKLAEIFAFRSCVAIRSAGTKITRSAMASTSRTVSSGRTGNGNIGELFSAALKLRKLMDWTHSARGARKLVDMLPTQLTKHSAVKRLIDETLQMDILSPLRVNSRPHKVSA